MSISLVFALLLVVGIAALGVGALAALLVLLVRGARAAREQGS